MENMAIAPNIPARGEDDTAPSWFVVHTLSRHEQRVFELFAQKGIPSFLPKAEVWSRRRDRRKKIQIPLFPGYLFVGATDTDTQPWVASTKGVVRILGFGGRPTPVPRSQVESIQIMVQGGDALYPLNRVVVGDRVRVLSGPLTGVEGVVVHSKGGGRLVVSVALLHRSVGVDLYECDLELISRQSGRFQAPYLPRKSA